MTHSMVLGFFSSIMMGAVQQMLPVLAGAVIKKPRLVAALIHICWVPGVLLLISAFIRYQSYLFISASILIAIAVVIFISTVLYSVSQAKTFSEPVPGIKLTVLSLFITLILGLILIAGYTGYLPLWRPTLTNLHLSWGLTGWTAVLVIAISWQVVPMFQIASPYPSLLRRFTVPLFMGLLLTKSLLVWFKPIAIFELLIDLWIAGLLLWFALATLNIQRNRRRKIQDNHVYFWRLSMINLILAVSCWIYAEISEQTIFDLLAASLYIMGFAMAVVTGMLIKIVSFLIWIHLQAAADTLREDGHRTYKVPKMKSVISSKKARQLLIGLIAAELSFLLALLWPQYFSFITGVIWLCQFCLLAWIIGKALYSFKNIIRQIENLSQNSSTLGSETAKLNQI